MDGRRHCSWSWNCARMEDISWMEEEDIVECTPTILFLSTFSVDMVIFCRSTQGYCSKEYNSNSWKCSKWWFRGLGLKHSFSQMEKYLDF
jgi:hypothetical protein